MNEALFTAPVVVVDVRLDGSAAELAAVIVDEEGNLADDFCEVRPRSAAARFREWMAMRGWLHTTAWGLGFRQRELLALGLEASRLRWARCIQEVATASLGAAGELHLVSRTPVAWAPATLSHAVMHYDVLREDDAVTWCMRARDRVRVAARVMVALKGERTGGRGGDA